MKMISKSFEWIYTSVTDSTCISSRQFNVPMISPRCSPRVFDVPVIISDAYQSYSVIQWSFTIVKNSRSVGWPVCGINSHWNRSPKDSRCQIITIININIAWNLEGTTFLCTCLHISFIVVFILMDNSVGYDIFQSFFNRATIATLISEWSKWTINKLLLWEIFKNSRVDLAKTFKSSSSWKSPACSTASLIFNWGNSTLWNPINITYTNIINDLNVVVWFSNNGSEVLMDKLFVSHGWKLVKSLLISLELVGIVGIYLG